MQKHLVLVVAFLFFSISYAQTKKIIKLKSDQNKFEVKSLKNSGFTIQNNLSTLNLKSVHSDEGDYIILESEGLIKTFDEGLPNIPVITKLIEVPQNAEVELIVKSFDEEIINLSDYYISDKILPALRTQFKSEDSVPFVKNETIYNTDDFVSKEIAVYHEVGQMRAIRLGRLQIAPIQYNPVRNTLRIINNLVIEVNFINADYSKTELLEKKYNTPYFNSLLKQSVINHYEVGSKELITQAPTHMVIVSDPMFESQLQPFIEWKVKKGFKITEAYTDVIGSTKAEIKTYLEGIYNGADPMSFVLFVGDVQQIPAWNGNAGSHVTDLRYCEYTGDNLPEVYYGRFSAQNTTQLQPQIDKTLMYEQFTMSDPSYLSEVFLVAGDDSSHEMTWGNGQIWYGDNYYFNATNNVNAHTYLQPLDNGAVHTIIVNDMNAGLAFANYTAHCGPSGWSSPSFETSDVNSLTNDEKYGVWIGNCCLSVKFDENECFGEAALRKANGGAIGDIGGSNSTTWDEDYWWGVGLTSSIVAEPTYADSGRGVYDGVWHNLANETSDPTTWFPTQGQIQVCGNLAVEASTSTTKEYYWEIYHLMGDPSVTNYIGTPQAMTVTPSPAALMIGMNSLTVTSAPYAYVALSQNGILIAAAVSDSSGIANLSFDGAALNVGSADLVVTCQNKIPSIGTITVSPANEPYVVLNSYTTSAPASYGETIGLNVTLENVAATGSGYDASNVVATISSTDTYVTINDNNENYGTIIAGNTLLINDAFNITIADNVPDQHPIIFDLHMIDDDSHVWDTTLNLVANAPSLTIGNYIIDDSTLGNGDGILDPGETATISIQATNEGHSDSSNVISIISTSSTDLIINETTAPTTALSIGETKDFDFSISANAASSSGTPADIINDLTAGVSNQYDATKEFEIIIGFVPEYCESYATNTADSMIEEVQFGSVVNNTAAAGCSIYSDFTEDESLTDAFAVGTTNDIKFFLGTCNGTFTKAGKVYIDWNYDGDFDDADEMVFESIAQDANWLAEGTFTVPTGISSGPRFMRIVVSEDETNINPCGTYSWGETEDYKIYVYDPLSISDNALLNITVYPNPNRGTFNIDLRRLNTAKEVIVELFTISGKLIYKSLATQSLFEINTNNISGIYFLRMTSGNQVINKKIIISN
jgi:hypothetical protein